MNNRKLNFLDISKVITCFLVVTGHVFCRYRQEDWLGWGGHNITLTYLASYIYSFHMPLFFMISGYVYGKQMYKKTDSCVLNNVTFIKKKIIRLIVPYIFFSILLTFVLYYVGHFQGSIFKNYYHTFFVSNDTYLWFLPCLFLISILYNSLGTYIQIGLYLFLLIFAGLCVSSVYLPNEFQIGNIARYSFFYLMGVMAQQNEKQLLKLFTAKNAGVLLLMHFIFFYLKMKTWGYVLINDILSIICALFGSLLVLIISFLISNDSILRSKIVGCFIRDGYSVYLIHPMLIYILYYDIFKVSGNYYVQVLIAILLSFGISMLFAFILRMVSCAWILGEKNVKHV